MASAAQTMEQPRVDIDDRWQPSTQGWIARFAVLFVIFGGILWITAIVPGYWADNISLAAIWAIIGLSLNIVLGYVGQVSLGHHAFVGIAAFVAAYYATEKAGCPTEGCELSAFLVATLFAMLSGAVAAGLLGVVALRIKGLYLALITLVYGFTAQTSIFEFPALTGGGAGQPAPRPKGFRTDTEFAFLTFVFLALVIFVDWRLVRSKVGRAIMSVKHSEAVAASYGINVTAYKILAFIMSGMFAGLAGALFAFRRTEVVANDFQFATGLLWVLMVVVGGLGNRVGVIIGSAFFAMFTGLIELDIFNFVQHFVENTLNRPIDYFTLVLGALLAIVTIIQFPGGIAEQISPITRWLRGEKFSMHPEGHGHHKKEKKPGLLARFGAPKQEPSPNEEAAEGTAAGEPPGERDTTEVVAAGPVGDREEE